MASRAVALVVISVVTVACGGSSGQQGRSVAPRDRNPLTFGPGRLVPIGGGRSLFLHCVGTGSPTVILESGFGGTSDDWSEVQPALGRVTRVCAYDRAGLGYSPPIAGVHDASAEIADLRRLLVHAGVGPTYVLVGHSYGGLLVRLFAHAQPHDIAGMVLVDPVGRNQDRRSEVVWRALPAPVRHRIPEPLTNPVSDGVDVLAGEALDAKAGTLGAIPLVVITRGKDTGLQRLPAIAQGPVDRLWMNMHDELAALSSDSVHVIALRSGHLVQRSADGQPNLVITAVLAAVHAARTGTHLPSCPRLFHGAGVQCRPSAVPSGLAPARAP